MCVCFPGQKQCISTMENKCDACHALDDIIRGSTVGQRYHGGVSAIPNKLKLSRAG